jgi:thiamine biosynthesis lipoprotein
MIDGKRVHHIIDPRTGYPAGKSQSVTVVAPNAATADALATALFVLGPEDGISIAERDSSIDALIVDRQGIIHATEGFSNRGLRLLP